MGASTPDVGATIFDFDGLVINSGRVEADLIIEVLPGWAPPSPTRTSGTCSRQSMPTRNGASAYVSGRTVNAHFGHILNKLGLRDRVHRVVFAYQVGLAQREGTDDGNRFDDGHASDRWCRELPQQETTTAAH